jgi:hypothetical protein
MTGNTYDSLIQKLDAFIRKYYKNQLIRGAIYFAAATLLFFFLVIVLEYFGRYQPTTRAALFYSFVTFSGFCLVRFMLFPLASLYKLGKTIDYAQASAIIGNHFPEVKDKLINVLQLKAGTTSADNSLIEAAIGQKTRELNPVPFSAAIDLNKNIKHLRYVALPVVLYVLVYLIAPGMISDGSKRVLHYNQTFKPTAPFTFVVENDKLQAQQFTDYDLKLKVEGAELPEEVFVVLNGNSYKMQKTDKLHFSYTFTNVQKDLSFQMLADQFYSDQYTLLALAKPLIVNYRARLDFPGYLGRQAEWVDNPADLTIPAGTVVTWQFNTSNTDEISLGFGSQWMKAEEKGKDQFSYAKKFFISGNYSVRTTNSKHHNSDSMQYSINVLPDAFPAISVDEKRDSLSGRQLFFIGDATDDHGLTKLAFHYTITRAGKQQQRLNQTQLLPIDRKDASTRFYHQLNLTETGIQPGDEISYYFEVWDNDGVHGAKSTKSAEKTIKAPTEKELEEKTEAGSSALKEKMEEAMKDAKSLQKEMKDLERKMLEKKELTWEEKKKLEQLMERQKELAQKLNEIKKENEKLNKEEAEYKQQQENIMEKQQQLEKMFNELMDEEMKKLIREMEQLMQMQNKDMMKQEMEKIQLNNKDVEKELDRMLEQYKKLELEKKLEQASDKLEKLGEKQEELGQKTEDAQKDNKNKTSEEKKQAQEELKQEQQKLSEEFKETQEELKEIEEKNKELESPEELENTDEEQQEIEKDQQGSEDDLEKKDNKSASQKQKKAGAKMKEMSAKMKDKKAEQEQKELELDAQALREILENTIQLSKDQEALMEQMKTISSYNPQYVDVAQKQKKIKDDAKIIEDSLLALSKRVAEISSFVNREVSKLNDNLDRSIKGFGTRNFNEIRTREQYSMTHANNLSVMLSDILKQMQDQMSGSSSDPKDGKGKPKQCKGGAKGKGKGAGKPKSMGELKKAQEELNKQLREGMNKQGNKGKDGQQKPGDGKPQMGGQGSPGGPGGLSSEEYARMAAQQQAIRQQMQKMMQQMGAKEKEAMGGNGKLQEMQKLMEQTEKELFNKQLTAEMLKRQQDILTRLLESEKAERKQEQDQKREAEQAKEKPAVTPPDFEQYLKQKNKEKELLETIPAELQPYYKEKAKEYFNKIGQE